MKVDCVVIHGGAQHGIYGQLGDKMTALEPPTWTRMLAGYVRSQGASVAIIDQEAEHLNFRDTAERVRQMSPKVVAIVVSGHQPSASTQQMTAAGAIARSVASAWPKAIRVMVGNHPTALPVQTLEEEDITGVIAGEAHLGLMALVNGMTFDKVPGFVWISHGEIVRNPMPPLSDDLDRDLNGEVWDLLPMNLYRAHNWHAFTGPRAPYASIYTTLGCPYKCEFCMINAFQGTNKYRCFNPAEVVRRIRVLYYRYGVHSIKLADEMFLLNESHYLAIARGLIESGINHNLNIWAYARVDTVKFEHLPMLYEAGFRWLALGIETADASIRDAAGKHLKRNDIVDVVRTIQNSGMSVMANYMFGMPNDTAETMQATLDLALDAKADFANFYCTMAYPGSILYDKAIKEGWKLPATWRAYSQHNADCTPLDTDGLTGLEVRKFRDEAFKTYFKDTGYRDQLRDRHGQRAVDDLNVMLSYDLKR